MLLLALIAAFSSLLHAMRARAPDSGIARASDVIVKPIPEGSAMQLSEQIELSSNTIFATNGQVVEAQSAWIESQTQLTSAVGLAVSFAYKSAVKAGMHENFPRNNVDIFTIAFVVSLVLSSIACVVWSRNSQLATRRQEIKRKSVALQDTIGLFVSEMDSNLKEMTHSTTLMAESIFQARRRDFLKFNTTVRDLPERFATEEFHSPFLRFVQHWLLVFQEYSIDPINHPLIVVSTSTLCACSNACGVAGLVAEHLEKQKHLAVTGPLSDLSQMFEKRSDAFRNVNKQLGTLKHVDRKGVRGTFPLISLKVMSLQSFGRVAPPQRVGIIGAVGLTIAAFHLHDGDVFVAAVTCLASLCSLFFFACVDDFDAVAMLENKVARLQQEHDSVRAHHALVKDFVANSQMLANLWLYRTVPSLDVLHEVYERLWDCPNDAAEYLELANAELERVVQSVGPISLWYGEDALGDDKLKILATQFADDVLRRIKLDYKENPEIHARIYKWVDKGTVSSCSGCKKLFGRFFYSKVHCQHCGDVFCDACTIKTIPIPSRGFEEPVRVCSQCAEAVEQASSESTQRRNLKGRLPSMLLRINRSSFLTVNVRQAFNLKDQRRRTYLMGNSKYFKDIFVRMRIGDGNWLQTPRVSDVANPKWNNEFFFPVRDQDSVLTVEVCSASNSHGSFTLNFRSLRGGAWHHERRKLEQTATGELRFDVLFAESAAELVERPMA